MNPAQFLAQFDRISDAPDAIPRLRRFILDLAVRGKLVEQDSKDESASELLKCIQTEKVRLVKEGKIGNQKPFEPIEESEIPFQIPQTWEWVPATFPAYLISDMGKKVQTRDVLESGEFPVVDQGKVFIRGYCNDRNRVIHIDAPIVLFGDHTRETKLINFDFVVGADGVKLLHPVCILTDYYYLALRWLPLDSRGYGRHFKLLRAATLPLPPLAEQQRIVAKVDELMALCDRLEAAQAERESRRDRLAAASLHRLNNGADADAFRNHARFYFNHLPRLTTRPEQIQQLRQTILNLAVRGKLVLQGPHDEPAAELLKRIQAEKVRQLKLGELKQQQPLPDADTIEAPFEIPNSWCWSRVDDCFAVGGGIQKTPARTPKDNPYPYIGVANVYRGRLDLSEVKKFELLEGDLERFRLVKGDILVVEGNGSPNEIGRCAIWSGEIKECVHQNHIIRCRPFILGLTPFVLRFLNSPKGIEIMKMLAITSSGLYSLSVGKIRTIAIPIPPLTEQHRIVAKVDELMVLCDRLKAQLTTTQTESRRLLETVLHEALSLRSEPEQTVAM